MVMRIFAVQGMLVLLCCVLAHNALMQFSRELVVAAGNNYVAVMVAVVIAALLLLPGCCGDPVKAMQAARLAAETSAMVENWQDDRVVLEQYADRLDAGDPDRAAVEDIIKSGDAVAGRIKELLAMGQIPSTGELQSIFETADRAIVAGSVLYRKYVNSVSYSDRKRAEEIGNSWSAIRRSMAAMSESISRADRKEIASNILSLLLDVTTRVVVPALASSGKLKWGL